MKSTVKEVLMSHLQTLSLTEEQATAVLAYAKSDKMPTFKTKDYDEILDLNVPLESKEGIRIVALKGLIRLSAATWAEQNGIEVPEYPKEEGKEKRSWPYMIIGDSNVIRKGTHIVAYDMQKGNLLEGRRYRIVSEGHFVVLRRTEAESWEQVYRFHIDQQNCEPIIVGEHQEPFSPEWINEITLDRKGLENQGHPLHLPENEKGLSQISVRLASIAWNGLAFIATDWKRESKSGMSLSSERQRTYTFHWFHMEKGRLVSHLGNFQDHG